MKAAEIKAKKNIEISVLNNKGFPKCFDSKKEFEDWQKHEVFLHTRPFRGNICEDCTKPYKTKMIFDGRCCNIGVIIKE